MVVQAARAARAVAWAVAAAAATGAEGRDCRCRRPHVRSRYDSRSDHRARRSSTARTGTRPRRSSHDRYILHAARRRTWHSRRRASHAHTRTWRPRWSCKCTCRARSSRARSGGAGWRGGRRRWPDWGAGPASMRAHRRSRCPAAATAAAAGRPQWRWRRRRCAGHTRARRSQGRTRIARPGSSRAVSIRSGSGGCCRRAPPTHTRTHTCPSSSRTPRAANTPPCRPGSVGARSPRHDTVPRIRTCPRHTDRDPSNGMGTWCLRSDRL